METKNIFQTKYITANERDFTLRFIDERKGALFDKSHDYRIINKKKEAWEEITTLEDY